MFLEFSKPFHPYSTVYYTQSECMFPQETNKNEQ